MCFQLGFVLYITNMTLPSMTQYMVTKTKLECSYLAIKSSRKSFFYNTKNGTCITYLTKIHNLTGLVNHTGFQYFVEDGPGCGPPPIPKGHQLIQVIESPGHYTARYKCGQMYVHRNITNTTCTGYPSQWSETPCKDFASCATIKECNSSYTADGEYWHYPSVLDSTRVRLYCKNMNTNAPKTYLTLHTNNNIFDYPRGRTSSSTGCAVYTYNTNAQGKTKFNKVGIDTDTMAVIQDDFSFTHNYFGAQIRYGVALCCSQYNTAQCLRGSGRIDVTDTGLKVSPQTTWKGTGWLPKFSINRTDHVVILRGDGGCGGVIVDGLLKLVNDSSTPPINSATDPVCNLLGL